MPAKNFIPQGFVEKENDCIQSKEFLESIYWPTDSNGAEKFNNIWAC